MPTALTPQRHLTSGSSVTVAQGPAVLNGSNWSSAESCQETRPADLSIVNNGLAAARAADLLRNHPPQQSQWNALNLQGRRINEEQHFNPSYPHQPPNVSRLNNGTGDATPNKSPRYPGGHYLSPQLQSNPPCSISSRQDHQQPTTTSSVPYLRPMPPLIPVTSIGTGHSFSVTQQQQQHHRLVESSIPSLHLDFAGQTAASSRGPPRKLSRFREGTADGCSESEHSPTSSASSSPPLDAYKDGDSSLRATSGKIFVISGSI